MIFHIGDIVFVNDSLKNIKDKRGTVTNIKYDAVANDYIVTFDDNTKDHFYRFQLSFSKIF